MATSANSLMGGGVRAASATLLQPGTQARVLSVEGAEALCFYRLDDAEHERRKRVSAARLDEMGALEALLALPVGVRVPLASLDRRARREVVALPAGSVVRDARSVIRQAVRPLRMDLAVVRASGWRSGLEAAGRFAPVCRRAMVLKRLPAETHELLLEANFYGVGVFVGADDGMEMVLEPRDYRPVRHTAAAWWYVEELYQRVR